MKNEWNGRFLLVLLGTVLLMQSVSSAGQAYLQIHGSESYSTNTDALPQGTYLLQYGNSISTIVTDDSPVLGNITYTLGADNMDHVIYVQDQQYASVNYAYYVDIP